MFSFCIGLLPSIFYINMSPYRCGFKLIFTASKVHNSIITQLLLLIASWKVLAMLVQGCNYVCARWWRSCNNISGQQDGVMHTCFANICTTFTRCRPHCNGVNGWDSQGHCGGSLRSLMLRKALLTLNWFSSRRHSLQLTSIFNGFLLIQVRFCPYGCYSFN